MQKEVKSLRGSAQIVERDGDEAAPKLKKNLQIL